MKIIIMNGNKDKWYSGKVGKVYKVQEVKGRTYVTKGGAVTKEDAEIIDRRN